MKKYSVHIIWGIVAIVALSGGFFYGRSGSATTRGGFAGGIGTFSSSTRRTAGGGGFVTGNIASVDSSSITLQLPNGNSEVVFYSSSTSVTEPTIVSISNLKTGNSVMIGGTQNSDGSLTAQSIQVRTGTPGGGFGGRNASGTAQ
jgi:hypothetical protein